MCDHPPDRRGIIASARLSDVADSHCSDEARLAAWLSRHVEGFGTALQVRQSVGGASNLTFMLTTDAGNYVLRKKPPGQLLASAHYRLAAINQGGYARALAGVTPNAGEAFNGTPMLAAQALALLHRDG